MSRAMKDSEVEWIGEIPENWVKIKLKKVVCQIDSGGTPSAGNELFYCESGVPFVNIADMTKNRIIFETKKCLTEDGVADKNLKVYPVGTILYSIYASIGKVAELHVPATISQAILAITPDESLINNIYFRYYLTSLEDYVKTISSGTTQMNLNREKVEKLIVAIPSLSEQKEIAAFLDEKTNKIESIIDNTKQSIDELKKYKQALILETVTKGLASDVMMKNSGVEWIGKIPEHWACSKIKYITSLSRGQFNHRPRNDERFYDGDYPFIQTGDVAKANKFVTSYSQTLNEFGKNVSKEFPKGTLVMTIAANVGDVAVLDFDSYFPDSVIGFVPNDGYYWNYLYYLFSAMKPSFVSTAIVSTQLNLNVERVKEMYAPTTADSSEQQQIADYLDEKCAHIDSLIADKEKLIGEFETYKKALIFEYVTGKKAVE